MGHMLGGRGQQEPALRDGRADIALLPQPFDDHGLDVEPRPRLLAVATADPLAADTCPHLDDLTGRVLPNGCPTDREGLLLISAADNTTTTGGLRQRVAPPRSRAGCW